MNNERFPFSITPNSITLMLNGRTYTITAESHQHYAVIREALKTKDFDQVRELIDIAQSVNTFGKGKVKVVNGVIMYGDIELHNSLSRRMLEQMKEGFEVDYLVNFLENLMQNPSARAVEETYSFLEQNALPITEDGYFVAYKRVTNDYKDFYTRSIDNSLGAVVTMRRNQVDDDKDRTCSHGLHFCSLEYLPHYHGGDGRIVIVKVNPRDVVSIPTDYNNAKGRCCEYTVIEEYFGGERNEKFDTSVYFTQPKVETTAEPETGFQFAEVGALEERIAEWLNTQYPYDMDAEDLSDFIKVALQDDVISEDDYNNVVILLQGNNIDRAQDLVDDLIDDWFDAYQEAIDAQEDAKYQAATVQPTDTSKGTQHPVGCACTICWDGEDDTVVNTPAPAVWPFPNAVVAHVQNIPTSTQPASPSVSVPVELPKLYTRKEACQKLGITAGALRKRLARGYSVSEVDVPTADGVIKMIKIL
jgi:hypothetical protein